MPDLRWHAESSAALSAALPLTLASFGLPASVDLAELQNRMRGWLTRDLAPKAGPRGWPEPNPPAADNPARPARLTDLEAEVLRVANALADLAPSITASRCMELTLAALTLPTKAECLAALRTLGDLHHLEGR